MKIALSVLAAALAVSVGANAFQAVPSGSPAKPIWQQRVEQLLDATNAGRWKQACDAAPTAAYSLNDYVMLALQFGITKLEDLGPLCERMLKGATADAKGKPVGLDYKVLYTESDVGKNPAGAERLVIVRVQWHGKGVPASVVTFHVDLTRVAWEKKSAKCKGQACPPLRWYVLGAT